MFVANLLGLLPKVSNCQHTTVNLNVLMPHRNVVVFFNSVQITDDDFRQKEMYCAEFGTFLFWNILLRKITRIVGVLIIVLEFTRLVLK